MLGRPRSVSRGLRIALVLATSMAYQAWHAHGHAAYAKGGDDDDDDSDDTTNAKGEDTGDDEDPEEAKEQPPITAGGLFTINTYPVREISRPLTMTQHISQLRLDVGTDISAKGAFASGGVGLQAVIGVTDNFSIIGGLSDAYNFKQFNAYVGFEGGLAYDLVDIRMDLNVHRFAIPRFCDSDAEAPSACFDPVTHMTTEIPDGNFDTGGTKFSLDIGFPFRYAFTPEIAIVALQTLISVDFNAVALDHVTSQVDATDPQNPKVKVVPVGNGTKPDLNPSLGLATNPIPPLSIVVFAQLRVPDFDTSVGAFQVPVTARLEFSPSQKFDIGIDFTLLNVKPPDPQSPIDNRFLSLFMQARI